MLPYYSGKLDIIWVIIYTSSIFTTSFLVHPSIIIVHLSNLLSPLRHHLTCSLRIYCVATHPETPNPCLHIYAIIINPTPYRGQWWFDNISHCFYCAAWCFYWTTLTLLPQKNSPVTIASVLGAKNRYMIFWDLGNQGIPLFYVASFWDVSTVSI